VDVNQEKEQSMLQFPTPGHEMRSESQATLHEVLKSVDSFEFKS
jgi:hypothetical protein